MLDYLVSLLNFTVDGTTYNLIITPWNRILSWVDGYIANSSGSYGSGAYSTAVRDAYEMLAKIGFMYACLVVVLVILCAWFVYKVASGFTGWFKFR